MSAKRDIENKVTQIMGSYLLKGYTLLDSHCQTCQTPLMKTKVSDLYCIYCQEIDVEESKPKSIASNPLTTRPINEDISGKRLESSCDYRSAINSNEAKADKEWVQKTISVVERKMDWATDRLKTCDQIGDCLQLINLMKASADLLLALNQIAKNQLK